ncbi:surface protein C [Limosilactobacillus frumenti DSM 13145]|uniref:Surface protein C n=1 Tax=Limosilactobacillus frumenti DSM 13145 TaxID=1423746 RepID=A0A0R1PBE4_9LACO|nr:hypothetical protein [Limosilactobacillus frumenti]KRL26195.1 surface protein C [Limosilactobacillus frumenti DSM 13145]QFG72947.1 hypothetical protein LF145_06290 [Limosilactobacillus frumenti]
MNNEHVHSYKLRNTILLASVALTLGIFASTTNTYANDKTPVVKTTTNNNKPNTDAANPTPTASTLDTTYASAKAAIDATSTESEANSVASQQKEQETKAISDYYVSQKSAKSAALAQEYNAKSAQFTKEYTSDEAAVSAGNSLTIKGIKDAYDTAIQANQAASAAQKGYEDLSNAVVKDQEAVKEAQKEVDEASAAVKPAKGKDQNKEQDSKADNSDNDALVLAKGKLKTAQDQLKSDQDALTKAKSKLDEAKKGVVDVAAIAWKYLTDLKSTNDATLAKLKEENQKILNQYDTDASAEISHMNTVIDGYLDNHVKQFNIDTPTGKANTWGEQKSKDGKISWYYYGKNGKAVQGWNLIGDDWYYFAKSNAEMFAGIKTINGKVYYFNPNHDGTFGRLLTGWQKVNGSWYWFAGDEDTKNNIHGGYAKTSWQKTTPANNWYYFDDNGKAVTGWFKSPASGLWYYFDPVNAWAVTGWFRSGAGHWYYFDPVNAWADTGWQSINGHWYYFDPTNAWATKGWYRSNAGNWYYFDPVNAWAVTGWFRSPASGLWYWFDQDNAWMVTNGWGFNHDNGQRYYFDAAGHPMTGWLKSYDGTWYYFQPGSDAALANGRYWIGGRQYSFGATGNWLQY